MSLYKKGKNWYIDYYYPPGRLGTRVREKVGPVKDEARIMLAKRLEDIRQGRNPELRKVSPTLFKAHARKCLTEHYGKKRCEPWARLVIERHLIPWFSKRLLGEMTPKFVSEYMTARLGDGVVNNTVNHERAVLSKIMNLAMDWELIHDNPVRRVKRLELPEGRPRFLTHDEADRLIANAPHHLVPVLVTALETGGRLSEVMGLKWEDVSFDRGLLYFDQTNTKNAKQREIPMTPALLTTLRNRSKVRAIGGDARIWLFTRYGKRLQDVRTAFEMSRKRAGLGPDVTFHTLRHTFASWYAMRGGDLNRLRALLGHQDLKTTMIYAHLSLDYMKAAVPLIGRQGAGVREIGSHPVDTKTGIGSEASV